MMNVGDELGIDLSQLKGWSRKVADDFKAINAPYSSAEEELATVVAENNRLVSDLRKEIADLKALAATNARTICHLETQLQKSDARALNGTSVPLIASGGVDSAVAGTSRPAGGTIRRREPSPPRSPDRNVRQRTAGGSGIIDTAISAIAVSPVAIARRMVGGAPPLPPSLSTVSSAGGKKKNKWPLMSEIVIELARSGKLKSGSSHESMPPPLAILPRAFDRNEKTKHKLAMRVVDAAVTKDQDDVFRAAEIDEAELVAKGKALHLEVRRWLASKMNKNLTKSRLTAQVLGVGANAQKLPDNAWPRSNGGLLGMFRK